ncbi:AhpC/TSA family protein [Pendulispora brunnea]|uniref:thioredoxin-dependent peroxiredoxin n=1 Tax=Pendulispora brunnea TaxID=2905690 RepID=A0ABZ2JYT2_9BACT
MTLQEQLDDFKTRFENGEFSFKPTRTQLDIMDRATSELIDGKAAVRALEVGELAPSFVLKDTDGRTVRSEDILARGPLVVSFYRGVWCPYSNLDLQALEASRAAIATHGAELVAISPQSPANSRMSQRQNRVGFPILSDPQGEVAVAFKVRFELPDYLVELYKGIGINLPIVNDDSSWALPMPARYVIASDRTIAYAEVSPDYTRRPDPPVLLPVLERLRTASRHRSF